MYNMILLPERKQPTKEILESILEPVVGRDNFEVDANEGGAVITLLGKVFSLIYMDEPTPLAEGQPELSHQAHLIISNLNKPQSVREGINQQIALERFLLLICHEFAGEWVYWSVSDKATNVEQLHSIVDQASKFYQEGPEAPSDLLPVNMWVSLESVPEGSVIQGFADLGEMDVLIKHGTENIETMKVVAAYITQHIFDYGRFFSPDETLSLPDGQPMSLKVIDNRLVLEL